MGLSGPARSSVKWVESAPFPGLLGAEAEEGSVCLIQTLVRVARGRRARPRPEIPVSIFFEKRKPETSRMRIWLCVGSTAPLLLSSAQGPGRPSVCLPVLAPLPGQLWALDRALATPIYNTGQLPDLVKPPALSALSFPICSLRPLLARTPMEACLSNCTSRLGEASTPASPKTECCLPHLCSQSSHFGYKRACQLSPGL